ncbi:hypothetical protein HZA57_08200, partial [Candidatus Poribacteria bacterium]|nr:hypothetical protein [Candidatus Poribacteria bacterium]
MGIFSHATYLYLSDSATGRVLAGALLKGANAVVIAPPQGKWLTVYLPLGLSYKDVPELPTASAIELNCYDSEGLDLRLYTQDRLAFHFESGGSEVSAEEDQLLEIAEDLWNKEHPDALKTQTESKDDEDTKPAGFWGLSQEQQNEYVTKARGSGEFRKFVETTSSEDSVPDVKPFEPFIPEGRTPEELHLLLAAVSHRLHGPPASEKEKLAL